MSVLHTLQIAPKSGTIKTLNDVQSFIHNLLEQGFIEKEFAIITGEADKIQGISSWDFMNASIKSSLVKGSKLELLADQNFENLSPTKNYAFKVHLTKSKPALANLGVFTDTDSTHFALFISLLSAPGNFTVIKEDSETEEFEEIVMTGLNCVITSDGRNARSLWDLAQNPGDFKEFYAQVKAFFGSYEIGSFYS